MYTVDLSMYKNETTVKKTHAYPQAKASEDCVFLEGIYGIFFSHGQNFSFHIRMRCVWTHMYIHERGIGVNIKMGVLSFLSIRVEFSNFDVIR